MTLASPLRLRLDGAALCDNWRWLASQSGSAACGAAVKADGYGLGARGVVERLTKAGCQDFFVATWGEASALGTLQEGVGLSVLHGVRDEDMNVATASNARPTLNSPEQVLRWRDTGQLCDVMVDTGMNRLGISAGDIADGLLEGLRIETLMSHLACADTASPMNEAQRITFAALAGMTSARRMSLANSAGICLGTDYAFDLTRPGLALYGGIPASVAQRHITQVVRPEAQIVQRRSVAAGESVGYSATFVAQQVTEVAILNIGYADGYLRGFSGKGSCCEGRLPVIGRVSMDLLAVCVDAAPQLREGAWIQIDYDLPTASVQSGLSQYELLTGLGARFDRTWD